MIILHRPIIITSEKVETGSIVIEDGIIKDVLYADAEDYDFRMSRLLAANPEAQVRELAGKFMNKTMWALSCFIPFVSAFAMASAYTKLKAVADEKGIKLIGNKVLFIIFGILIPVLPLNIIALIIMQNNLNKIYKAEKTVEA